MKKIKQSNYTNTNPPINDMEWCKVGTMEFAPSRVLQALDPVAYNCGFSDFCDSLAENHQLVEGFY
jgi:hypothetical protein